MIIGVDIDNVIADTEKELRRVIHQRTGLLLEREDIKDYALANLPGIDRRDLEYLLSAFQDGEIFRRLEVIDGARETLEMLRKRHKVVLVTSRPERVADATREWLSREGIPHDELYFVTDSKLNGIQYELFLEDQDKFALELAESGTYVLLYDAPWNRHVAHDNMERVRSWDDIRKFCFPPCALGH